MGSQASAAECCTTCNQEKASADVSRVISQALSYTRVHGDSANVPDELVKYLEALGGAAAFREQAPAKATAIRAPIAAPGDESPHRSRSSNTSRSRNTSSNQPKEDILEFYEGDRVRVRDERSQDWKSGTVTSLEPLMACPDGWKRSFEWVHIRKAEAPCGDASSCSHSTSCNTSTITPAQRDHFRRANSSASQGSRATASSFTGLASLSLSFRLPDRSVRTLPFIQRPLGLDFQKGMPPVVKGINPDSHAHDMGVENGWVLTRVNGRPIEGMTFLDIYSRIKQQASRLPEVKDFLVSIDRSKGERLGIVTTDRRDEASLRIDSISGGLFGKWNNQNKKSQVKPGDRITAINGIHGDVAKLCKECRQHHLLEMTIRRLEQASSSARRKRNPAASPEASDVCSDWAISEQALKLSEASLKMSEASGTVDNGCGPVDFEFGAAVTGTIASTGSAPENFNVLRYSPVNACRISSPGPSSSSCTSDLCSSLGRVPVTLHVVSPSKTTCGGEYRLLNNARPNGFPIWRKTDSKRWLYCGTDGRWYIGGSWSKERRFHCSAGYIYNPEAHRGVMPDRMAGSWEWGDGSHWEKDPSITISAVGADESTYTDYTDSMTGSEKRRHSIHRTLTQIFNGEHDEDSPGAYVVTHSNVPVQQGLAVTTPTIEELVAGTLVNVAEVAQCPDKKTVVRGRVLSPAGWISLLDEALDFRWAKKQACLADQQSQVCSGLGQVLSSSHVLPGPVLGEATTAQFVDVVVECVYAADVDLSSLGRWSKAIAKRIPAGRTWTVGPADQKRVFDSLVPNHSSFLQGNLFMLHWEPPRLLLAQQAPDLLLLLDGAPIHDHGLSIALPPSAELSFCDSGSSPSLAFHVRLSVDTSSTAGTQTSVFQREDSLASLGLP